jgi:hypothetical protein
MYEIYFASILAKELCIKKYYTDYVIKGYVFSSYHSCSIFLTSVTFERIMNFFHGRDIRNEQVSTRGVSRCLSRRWRLSRSAYTSTKE